MEFVDDKGRPFTINNLAVWPERVVWLLSRIYRRNSAEVAKLCDEHLDRTGGLLGRVRHKAALHPGEGFTPDEERAEAKVERFHAVPCEVGQGYGPCYKRDGEVTLSDKGVCVGCGRTRAHVDAAAQLREG